MSTAEILSVVDESLSDQIYRDIRGRIINGRFEQGSRLRERDLAADMGVSRIPLREAFPQLESDGFIVSLPRRGVRVTTLTLEDLDQLFEARLGMEVYATGLAAKRVAEGASVEDLKNAMEAAERAYGTADADVIVDANANVHDEIVRLAANSLLWKMMQSISGRYRWIFRLTFTPQVGASGEEHGGIYAAIRAGNVDAATVAARAHIVDGRESTLERFRQTMVQA
jgi:DNA-binding GntR family transcriptional regulator